MNKESCLLGAGVNWLPHAGIDVRKAGYHFDAIRVDGDPGRRLANLLEGVTVGDPGPIYVRSSGNRAVYFLLPPGSTKLSDWPTGMTCFNHGPNRACYVPLPAVGGGTWPLVWWFPPTGPEDFVHPLLLRNAGLAVLK
ncbi:hypothetical protein ACH41E_24370 [Streptomyces sp. NPDC020412]|uniref:hypothetical protein n=1 Tax=Streptomyces sp. NPDC020412 TaxID=3365073 RepID=UPI0037B32D47